MEHLKDIVNGLLNSLPAEAAENEKIKRQDNCKKQDMVSVVMFILKNLMWLSDLQR